MTKEKRLKDQSKHGRCGKTPMEKTPLNRKQKRKEKNISYMNINKERQTNKKVNRRCKALKSPNVWQEIIYKEIINFSKRNSNSRVYAARIRKQFI